MRAWRERAPFHDLLAGDPDVSRTLSAAELAECFDPAWYVKNVDAIFRRAGLL
jgi:adenylosuccinate lyase